MMRVTRYQLWQPQMAPKLTSLSPGIWLAEPCSGALLAVSELRLSMGKHTHTLCSILWTCARAFCEQPTANHAKYEDSIHFLSQKFSLTVAQWALLNPRIHLELCQAYSHPHFLQVAGGRGDPCHRGGRVSGWGPRTTQRASRMMRSKSPACPAWR